jgi:hypothetical protein
MDRHPGDADGLVRPDLEFGPARIVDDDVLLSDHFERLVGPDDDGRRFIDADAEKIGVLGQYADQPVMALARGEVLVDDGAPDEAQARGRDHVAGLDRLELVSGLRFLDLVARDHDLAHDGCSGARPADDRPVPVDLQEFALDGRSQQGLRHPGLIAAGEIDAADPVQDRGRLRRPRLFAGQDPEFDAPGPESLQFLDHVRSGFGGRRAGHGKDQDAAGVGPFGQGDELPGHFGIAVSAADDEQAALGGGRGGQHRAEEEEGETELSFFHGSILGSRLPAGIIE